MLFARAVIVLYLCMNLLGAPNYVTCDEPDLVVEPTETDFKRASRDSVKVDVNVSPALSENEMYRDILHLTKDNFTEIVLTSKDPWVIIFHDGNFYKTWKTMAASLRGIIWIGLVHQEEKEILKTLVSRTFMFSDSAAVSMQGPGSALEVAGPNYMHACGPPLYYLVYCIYLKTLFYTWIFFYICVQQ